MPELRKLVPAYLAEANSATPRPLTVPPLPARLDDDFPVAAVDLKALARQSALLEDGRRDANATVLCHGVVRNGLLRLFLEQDQARLGNSVGWIGVHHERLVARREAGPADHGRRNIQTVGGAPLALSCLRGGHRMFVRKGGVGMLIVHGIGGRVQVMVSGIIVDPMSSRVKRPRCFSPPLGCQRLVFFPKQHRVGGLAQDPQATIAGQPFSSRQVAHQQRAIGVLSLVVLSAEGHPP